MKLNNRAVDNAKPREKKWKLADGHGLHLLVHPNGGKYWRFKYRLDGKEQEMALGVYPEVSLKQARQRHQAAREMLANGIDPGQDKRDRRLASQNAAGNTFGAIAAEFDEVKMTGLAPTTLARNRQIIRDYLIPAIWHRPADDIRPAELLAALRRVEATGAIETAKRARSLASLWVGDGTKNSGGSHTLESPSANDLGPHGPDMIGQV